VEWVGAIKKSSSNRLNNGLRRRFSLLGLNIDCLVDTGSPVNIIDETTFNKLCPRPTLSKCKTTYFPYGDGCSPIPIIGQFITRIQYGGKECAAGFVVVGPNEECLIDNNREITVMVSEIPDFEYRKDFFTLVTLVQTFTYSNVNIITKNFPLYRQIFQKIVSQNRKRNLVT
jgi:hypothetical protein